MTQTLRCFIALDISETLKETIKRLRAEFFTADAGIRWVKPENLHLTLKFLGEVEPGKIDEIIETIEGLACGGELLLDFNALGVFPDPKHARIIWLGSDENASLCALVAELENALAALGFAKEKRAFKPHITIGRVKPTHNAQAIAQAIVRANGRIACAEGIDLLTLYKSQLSSAGPHYEILHQRRLKP